MGKTIRQSNIELLRIISMLMIILNHLAGHGVMRVLDNSISYQLWWSGGVINRVFTASLRSGGEVGVAIFFIISGFFSIEKEKIGVKKIILETLFYGLLSSFTLGFLFIKDKQLLRQIGAKTFLQYTLTPITGGYWFVAVYVFMIFLLPIINPLIRKLNKRGLVCFLCFFWLFGYAIGSIGSLFYQLQKGIFFYICGAYIRLYRKSNGRRLLSIAVFLALWIVGAYLSYKMAYYGVTKIQDAKSLVIQNVISLAKTGLIVPGCAVSLFVAFISRDILPSKAINTIAATTFGVYLIHDSLAGREIIWHHIFQVDSILYQSVLFPIYSFGVAIIILFTCSVFDFFRMKYIEPIYTRLFDRFTSSITRRFIRI